MVAEGVVVGPVAAEAPAPPAEPFEVVTGVVVVVVDGAEGWVAPLEAAVSPPDEPAFPVVGVAGHPEDVVAEGAGCTLLRRPDDSGFLVVVGDLEDVGAEDQEGVVDDAAPELEPPSEDPGVVDVVWSVVTGMAGFAVDVVLGLDPDVVVWPDADADADADAAGSDRVVVSRGPDVPVGVSRTVLLEGSAAAPPPAPAGPPAPAAGSPAGLSRPVRLARSVDALVLSVEVGAGTAVTTADDCTASFAPKPASTTSVSSASSFDVPRHEIGGIAHPRTRPAPPPRVDAG